MLHNEVERKFEEIIDVSDWEVLTDTGWTDISNSNKTVKYDVWKITLASGYTLTCADTHIVFTEHYEEIFVKDCIPNKTKLITDGGLKTVTSVSKLQYSQHMYDLTVGGNHRYITNGILSHNTEVSCAYLLHNAIFKRDQNILIAANKFDQAKEIIKRIKQAYAALPNWLKPGVTIDGWNKQSVKFENGSSIIGIATTGDSGRGKSISILYVDEFAFVKPNMAHEFWASIRPTLSTGGRCLITSTPNNDDDEFAKIWFGALDKFDDQGNQLPDNFGRNNFRSFNVIWDAHPERNLAWKEKELLDIGEARFLREHENQFISFDETLIDPVFTAEVLNNATKEPIKFTSKNVRWFDDIKPNHQYVVALDPCVGTGDDNAAIQILRLPDMIQIGEWTDNRTRIDGQVRVLKDVLKHINSTLLNDPRQTSEPDIFWSVENNVVGEAALLVIKHTNEETFPGIFVNEPKRSSASGIVRKGFHTSSKKKLEACIRFKSMLEKKKLTLFSAPLVREIKFFARRGEYLQTKYAAKDGEHDDMILAMLLCLRIVDVIIKWDDTLLEELSDTVNDTNEFAEPMPMLIL